MKKSKLISTTFKVAIAFLLLIAMTLGFYLIMLMRNPTRTIVDYEPYIVREGDTLWSIAKMSNGYNHIDIRDIIADIEIEYGKDKSMIRPKDIVFIPEYTIITEEDVKG